MQQNQANQRLPHPVKYRQATGQHKNSNATQSCSDSKGQHKDSNDTQSRSDRAQTRKMQTSRHKRVCSKSLLLGGQKQAQSKDDQDTCKYTQAQAHKKTHLHTHTYTQLTTNLQALSALKHRQEVLAHRHSLNLDLTAVGQKDLQAQQTLLSF